MKVTLTTGLLAGETGYDWDPNAYQKMMMSSRQSQQTYTIRYFQSAFSSPIGLTKLPASDKNPNVSFRLLTIRRKGECF
jgi:hypothetical protein